MNTNPPPATAGGPWAFRPPPRGLIPEEYQLCPEMIASTKLCLIADQCTMAHSGEELAEWKLRFAANMESQTGPNHAHLDASNGVISYSFGEDLLQRWMQSPNPEAVMTDRLPDIGMTLSGESEVTMSSKIGSTDWLLRISVPPSNKLRRVALIQDWHRRHFRLVSVKMGENGKGQISTMPLLDDQEWVDVNDVNVGLEATVDANHRDRQLGFDPGGIANGNNAANNGGKSNGYIPPLIPPPNPGRFYVIHVQFQTDIYGTFRQTVCFDFGEFPVLVKRLCVDSLSMIELDKLMEVRESILSHGKETTGAQRWTEENCEIVEYGEGAIQLTEEEKGLLRHYPPPNPAKLNVSNCATSLSFDCSIASGGEAMGGSSSFLPSASESPFRPEVLFSKDVYVPRIHELLAIEEIAMFDAISKYNVQVDLELTQKFLLLPGGFSSVKQAPEGTLFAKMTMEDSYMELSEDTAAGR